MQSYFNKGLRKAVLVGAVALATAGTASGQNLQLREGDYFDRNGKGCYVYSNPIRNAEMKVSCLDIRASEAPSRRGVVKDGKLQLESVRESGIYKMVVSPEERVILMMSRADAPSYIAWKGDDGKVYISAPIERFIVADGEEYRKQLSALQADIKEVVTEENRRNR